MLLLGAVVVFVLYGSAVLNAIEQPILGVFTAYVAFPLFLLALVETCGRILQHIHDS